jgi:hypothetical protein
LWSKSLYPAVVKNCISDDKNSFSFFLKVRISNPRKRMERASRYILLEVTITLVLCLTDAICTYICCMNFVSQTGRKNERTECLGLSLHDCVCLPFSFAYISEIWCDYYYRNSSGVEIRF